MEVAELFEDGQNRSVKLPKELFPGGISHSPEIDYYPHQGNTSQMPKPGTGRA